MNSRFLGCLLLVGTLGCQHAEETIVSEQPDQVAFDSISKLAYAIDAKIVLPIANPHNEKSQLQPALFCTKCLKWSPSPPLDQLNRNPGAATCQRDGTPLVAEGPLPKDRLEVLPLDLD